MFLYVLDFIFHQSLPINPVRPPEFGRTRPSARIRPNPPVRPNPAELRLGTAARIRPNSDLGRPSESGRTQIGDDRPNPAEKYIF